MNERNVDYEFKQKNRSLKSKLLVKMEQKLQKGEVERQGSYNPQQETPAKQSPSRPSTIQMSYEFSASQQKQFKNTETTNRDLIDIKTVHESNEYLQQNHPTQENNTLNQPNQKHKNRFNLQVEVSSPDKNNQLQLEQSIEQNDQSNTINQSKINKTQIQQQKNQELKQNFTKQNIISIIGNKCQIKPFVESFKVYNSQKQDIIQIYKEENLIDLKSIKNQSDVKSRIQSQNEEWDSDMNTQIIQLQTIEDNIIDSIIHTSDIKDFDNQPIPHTSNSRVPVEIQKSFHSGQRSNSDNLSGSKEDDKNMKNVFNQQQVQQSLQQKEKKQNLQLNSKKLSLMEAQQIQKISPVLQKNKQKHVNKDNESKKVGEQKITSQYDQSILTYKYERDNNKNNNSTFNNSKIQTLQQMSSSQNKLVALITDFKIRTPILDSNHNNITKNGVLQSFAIINQKSKNQKVENKFQNNNEKQKNYSPQMQKKILSGIDKIKNEMAVTEKSIEEDKDACEDELKEKASSESQVVLYDEQVCGYQEETGLDPYSELISQENKITTPTQQVLPFTQILTQSQKFQYENQFKQNVLQAKTFQLDYDPLSPKQNGCLYKNQIEQVQKNNIFAAQLIQVNKQIKMIEDLNKEALSNSAANDNKLFELKQKLKDLIYKKILEKQQDNLKMNLHQNYLKFNPKIKKRTKKRHFFGKYSQSPQGILVSQRNNNSQRQNSPQSDQDLYKNLVCQSVRSHGYQQIFQKESYVENDQQIERKKIKLSHNIDQTETMSKQNSGEWYLLQQKLQPNQIAQNNKQSQLKQFDVKMRNDRNITKEQSKNNSTQQSKQEELIEKQIAQKYYNEKVGQKDEIKIQNDDLQQNSQNQKINTNLNSQLAENGLSFLIGSDNIDSHRYYSPRIMKGQISNKLYNIDNNKYSQDLISYQKNSQSIKQKQENSDKTQIKETVNSSQMENIQNYRYDPQQNKSKLYVNTNYKLFTPIFKQKSQSPQLGSKSPKVQLDQKQDSQDNSKLNNTLRLQHIQTKQSQYKEQDQKSKFQNQDIQELECNDYDKNEKKEKINKQSELSEPIKNEIFEKKQTKISRLEDQEIFNQQDLDQKFQQFGIIKNQETGQSFVVKNMNSEQCISMDQIQQSVENNFDSQKVQIADLMHFKQSSEFYDETSQIHQMNSKLSPNISIKAIQKKLNPQAFQAVSHDVSKKNTIEEIINSARDVKVVNQLKKKSIPLEQFKIEQNELLITSEQNINDQFQRGQLKQLLQNNIQLNLNLNSNEQSKLILEDSKIKEIDQLNTSRFQIILDINSGTQRLQNIVNQCQIKQDVIAQENKANLYQNQPILQMLDSFSADNSLSELNRNIKTAATNKHQSNYSQLAWTNKNTPINCLRFFNLRKSKQANEDRNIKVNDSLEIISQQASRNSSQLVKNIQQSFLPIRNIVHSQFPVLEKPFKSKKIPNLQQNPEHLKKQVNKLKSQGIQRVKNGNPNKEKKSELIEAQIEETRPFSQNNQMNMKIIEHNIMSDDKSLADSSNYQQFEKQQKFNTYQSQQRDPQSQFSKTWHSRDFKMHNQEAINKKMFLKKPQILIQQNSQNNQESSLIDNKETTQNYSRNSSFSNLITPSSYITKQNIGNRLNTQENPLQDTGESDQIFELKMNLKSNQNKECYLQNQSLEAQKKNETSQIESYNRIYYPNSKIIVNQSVLLNNQQKNDNLKSIITPSVQRQLQQNQILLNQDQKILNHEYFKKVKIGSELAKQNTDIIQNNIEQKDMIKINRQKYATPSEITNNFYKDQTLKTQSVKPSSNINSSQNKQEFSFVNSSSKLNEREILNPNFRYGRNTENSEIIKGMELEKNMIEYYVNNTLTLQEQVENQIKIKNNEAQNKILNQAINDYRNIMDGYGSNKSTVYLNTNRSKKKDNEKVITIIEGDEIQNQNKQQKNKQQLSEDMQDIDEEILSQISILQIQKFNEIDEKRQNIYSNDSLESAEDKQLKKNEQNYSFKQYEINNTDRSDCEKIKKALEKNYNNIQKELNIQTLESKINQGEKKNKVSFEDTLQLNNEQYLQIINNPNRLRAQYNLNIQLQKQIQQNIDNLNNGKKKDQLRQFHRGSSPGMIESIETLRNDLSQSINKINRNEYINSPILSSLQENISNLAQEDSYHLSPMFQKNNNLANSFILQMNKNQLHYKIDQEDKQNSQESPRKQLETSKYLKLRNQKVVDSLMFQQKSKNNQLFPIQTYIENMYFQEQKVEKHSKNKYIYRSVEVCNDPSNRSSQIIYANNLQFKESQIQNNNQLSQLVTERKFQQDFVNKQKELIQSQKHIQKLQRIPKQNIKVNGQTYCKIEDLKSIFTSPKEQFKNIITPASRIEGRTTYQSYLNQQKAIQQSVEIQRLVKQKKLLADIMMNYQIQKDFTMSVFK